LEATWYICCSIVNYWLIFSNVLGNSIFA
jgi:hypothetical protein